MEIILLGNITGKPEEKDVMYDSIKKASLIWNFPRSFLRD